MEIVVRLFAGLRERAGTGERRLELADKARVSDVWAALDLGDEPGGLLYAVNLEYAPREHELADGVASFISHGRIRRFFSRHAATAALEVGTSLVARRERRHTGAVLSPNAQHGLGQYLEGPLRNQLVTECNGDPPTDLTFVFGHTHKPFADVMEVPGYSTAVRLMNTGGWVVDGLDPEPLHGASAILVDEDMDAVMLRFYAQRSEPSEYRTVVQPPPGKPDSEFARRITAIVERNPKPWRELSAAIAVVVAQRNRELAQIIGRPDPRGNDHA